MTVHRFLPGVLTLDDQYRIHPADPPSGKTSGEEARFPWLSSCIVLSFHKVRITRSQPDDKAVMPMSVKDLEMIQRLKLLAIRRCEERIEHASKEGGEQKESQPTPFGISALLKNRHGL
jgi:hypothetical protein